MEDSISIRDLMKLFRDNIVLIIVVTLLGGAVTFGYNKFMVPIKYSSQTTLYVQNDSNNSASNIGISKQLASTCVELMKDNSVMSYVGDMLVKQFEVDDLKEFFSISDDGTIPSSEILNCFSFKAIQDTLAVKVIVTTRNQKLSSVMCNDLIAAASDYTNDVVGKGVIVKTVGDSKIFNYMVPKNVMKNTLLGACVAFVIIFLLIYFLDSFDDRLKDDNKIVQVYKKPIFGKIKSFDDGKKIKKSDKERHLISDIDTSFRIIEDYKFVRANVVFSLSILEKKILAVSSPNASEGKSTSAANIAIALAQNGSSVLLMDADMRKPVQHRFFKTKNSQGLSTLIIQKSSIERSIKSTGVKNLYLIPAGPIPPNPSELLASPQFAKLLDQLSQNYDYVIVDTPPINEVSDTMSLSNCIGGLLLVVRFGKTCYKAIENCMNLVNLSKLNVIGFLINDIYYKRSLSYEYKNYKSYKNYEYKSDYRDYES